jgi:hypothetical protein
MKNRQKHQRKRSLLYIFGNDRLDELLWQLLDDCDPNLRAYVYRLDGMIKRTPALFIGVPHNGLIEWLRDDHNGGDFHIIIRRGKCMALSGIICIGAPVNSISCAVAQDYLVRKASSD